MLAIIVTISCRYDGSCLMAVMTLASAAGPPSESDCSEVATTSLHLCWRPSSALATSREAAIKLEGSTARVFSGANSFTCRFLLSPTAGLSLGVDGPAMPCCCR